MSNSTSAPLSPRTGLAIAAAVTGLTLALGATLATSLGWVRPPTVQASASPATTAAPTVAAPVAVPTGGPAGVDVPSGTTLTHVDEAGNVWAWYGSGDWVLVTPAPPAPAPVLAAGRQGRSEREEHASARTAQPPVQSTGQRSFFAGREGHDDD